MNPRWHNIARVRAVTLTYCQVVRAWQGEQNIPRCSVLGMLGAAVELWFGGTCGGVRVQGVARYAAKGRMEALGRWRGNRWTSGWAAAPLAIRVSQATLRELKCNAAAWIGR